MSNLFSCCANEKYVFIYTTPFMRISIPKVSRPTNVSTVFINGNIPVSYNTFFHALEKIYWHVFFFCIIVIGNTSDIFRPNTWDSSVALATPPLDAYQTRG